MARKLGDYGRWCKPCTHCGYDSGKIGEKSELRCWKCGRRLQRDYTDRALKIRREPQYSDDLKGLARQCPKCDVVAHYEVTGRKTTDVECLACGHPFTVTKYKRGERPKSNVETREYENYEFCMSVGCESYHHLETWCIAGKCRKTASEFYHWLRHNKFKIVKQS